MGEPVTYNRHPPSNVSRRRVHVRYQNHTGWRRMAYTSDITVLIKHHPTMHT